MMTSALIERAAVHVKRLQLHLRTCTSSQGAYLLSDGVLSGCLHECLSLGTLRHHLLELFLPLR